MQAGIDLNAVVIDPGSTTIKLGYAGFENPSCFFDPHVGFIDDPTIPIDHNALTKPYAREYYNEQITPYQPYKQVQKTIQNGLICDFDKFESVLASAFTQMKVNPIHNPVLITEPLYNTKPRREELTEMMFESFRTPQYTMISDIVCDAFSVGKPAGLVMNMGSGKTTIAAVVDGHAIYNSARVSKIAGDSVDVLLSHLLANTHALPQPLTPLSYQFLRQYDPIERKTILSFNPSVVDTPGSPSYHAYMERKILRDIKHQCLRVPMTPYNPEVGSEIENFYALPDGKIINVGEIGCILGESWFSPAFKLGSEILTDFDKNAQSTKATSFTTTKFVSLPMTVHSCIMDSDVDIRTMLMNNIVLTGGNALMHGLSQRFQIEMSSIFPGGFQFNITKQLTQFERQYGTWIGGSITASLSSFAPRWIYKAEYEEFGKSILTRKMP